jgi:hypothetical protein
MKKRGANVLAEIQTNNDKIKKPVKADELSKFQKNNNEEYNCGVDLKLSLDEDLNNINSGIEKCSLGVKANRVSKNRDKSPLNNENDKNFINSMYNQLGSHSIISSSIRKHFNLNESTEDKIKKERQNHKFKAKPLNRQVYNLNLNLEPRLSLTSNITKPKDIISFEDVIKTSRLEKQFIMKEEKENLKIQKIKEIKKRHLMNRENINKSNKII